MIIPEFIKAGGKKASTTDHGLAQWGYMYMPDKCLEKKCKMTMYLHGCGGTASRGVQMYAPLASANDIVMLYPVAENCWVKETSASDITKNSM